MRFLDHNIRDKLHEIKRLEVERLRHLATKEYELTNNITIDTGHLDEYNLDTFEIEDLRKLILKVSINYNLFFASSAIIINLFIDDCGYKKTR